MALETTPYTLTKVPVWGVFGRFVYAVLVLVGVSIVAVFGWWWFQPEHIPQNFAGRRHIFDFGLFFLLTYVVWYQVVNELFVWWTGLFMKHPVPTEPEAGLKIALATAFVPGKEPYDILEQTVQAMQQVAYPHESWVLDEGDDEEVKRICAQYGVNHFSRKGIAHYNTQNGHFKAKTKAGNYNAWFDRHGQQYEIIAQHDVDFAPKPEFLGKTLGYFKDPAVAFVGSPQIYGNTGESWIAKAAAEQAYGFYGPIQKGLFGQDMPLFIGANHVFRTKAHDSIGGYSGHIVEDHLTGMRLYSKRWKSVYVPEILLVGEGPATWDAYFSQQMRWAYGLIDILFRHTLKLAPKMRWRHALNYMLLQQYYFFGVAQLLGLLLIGLYLVFGVAVAQLELTTLLILYPSFVIMQIVINLWMQRSYIDQKTESGFHLLGKFLNIVVWPIYVLALVSAFVGRKITYQVTPKGSAQHDTKPGLGLFVSQILVALLAFSILGLAFYSERQNAYQIFWLLLVLFVMGGVVLRVSITMLLDRLAWRLQHSPVVAQSITIVLVAASVVGGSCIFYQSLSPVERQAIAVAYNFNPPTDPESLFFEPEGVAALPVTDQPELVEHVVQQGEYLRAIATEYYGDAKRWREIEHEGNPNLIYPGQVLVLHSDPTDPR